MSDTTYDLARRCYKCEQPGMPAGQQTVPGIRGKLHIFRCDNSRCEKYELTWVVQVRPDGTVPEPTTVRDKSFLAETGVREKINRARADTDALLSQSVQGGAQARNTR